MGRNTGRPTGVHTSPERLKHAGGRALVATAKMALVGRKYSPDRLQKLVRFARQMPVIADICRRAGISRTSLKYYMAKSEKGQPGDGFDMTVDDEPMRFHEVFKAAFDDGLEGVEHAAFKLAYGTQREILTHHGRVQYKVDPDMVALGFEGADTFMKDEHGDPIPETIPLQEPDMIRFLLKTRMPEKYGDRSQVDIMHRGGVLVVGMRKPTKQLEEMYGGIQAIPAIEFIEEEADDVDPTA